MVQAKAAVSQLTTVQSKSPMNMREIQAGLGFGVKKFSVIFVFENQKVLDDFVKGGWDAGGQN